MRRHHCWRTSCFTPRGENVFLTRLTVRGIIVAMIRNKAIKEAENGSVETDDDERLYELQANVCLALANPKRLRVLNLLKDHELSVGEMTEAVGITKANLSQHLAILRQQNLVRTRREGTTIFYRLANPKITEACAIMRSVLAESLTISERLSRTLKENGRAK